MKFSFFSVSVFLILALSFLRFSSESLPLLHGQYLFWLPALTLLSVFALFKGKDHNFKFTFIDGLILLFSVMGIVSFLFLSKVTIYSVFIWHYIGYLVFYLVLRRNINTKEKSNQSLDRLLYFCLGAAIVNGLVMYLQWIGLVPSPNEYFSVTGLFVSLNQSGVLMSLGCLSGLFLWEKAVRPYHKTIIGALILFLLLGIAITESRGAFLALGIALMYYLYQSKKSSISRLDKKTTWGVSALILISLIFVSIFSVTKTDSSSGRYFITKQALNQISQNPMGYGITSFSREYNKAKATHFESTNNWEEVKSGGYIFNANNDVLELTFEYGVIWAVLFLLFIALVFLQITTSSTANKSRAFLLCLLLFAVTNSILPVPALLLISCFYLALFIGAAESKIVYEFKNWNAYTFIGFALTLAFGYIQISRISAELKLQQMYFDSNNFLSEDDLKSCITKIDHKGEGQFMGGLVLLQNDQKEAGLQQMIYGFEKSGRPSFGKMLAEGLINQEKYEEAEIVLLYNKHVEPFRFEARDLLFDLYYQNGRLNKARKMAREIIDLPIKIPSSEVNAYKSKAKINFKKLTPGQ